MNSELVRNILKRELALKKISYLELSKRLKISLPTVKRMMNSRKFRIDELESVLDVLDLDWVALANQVQKMEFKRTKLSHKQESFLVNKPKETYAYIRLCLGQKPRELSQHLGIDSQSLQKIINELEATEFLRSNAKNGIQILVKPPFAFDEGSGFVKKFFTKACHKIFDDILLTQLSKKLVLDSGKDIAYPREIYLTKKTFNQFKLDLVNLISLYAKKSLEEIRFSDVSELIPVTQLFVLAEYPLWKKILWDFGSD
jgi:hypothetical protein